MLVSTNPPRELSCPFGQNTENPVSREYVKALSNVMHHGVRLRFMRTVAFDFADAFLGFSVGRQRWSTSLR